MRIDIDTYKEITDTLTRNKSRSFLTGFGIFWGIFMLIFLMGGGQGVQDMLQQNFAGFAQNSAFFIADATTKEYKGMPRDREWNLNNNDIERLKKHIPELHIVTPIIVAGRKNSVIGDKNVSASIQGVGPNYKEIYAPQIKYGRYINEIDIKEKRKVCVIGRQVYETLFSVGEDPCGSSIRVDSTYYYIVGVDYKGGGGINITGRPEECITIPRTVLQTTYNRGSDVDLIAVTVREGFYVSNLMERMRETIARNHTIDPSDEAAIVILNTEAMFSMIDNLFKGVNFLIWLIGVGTLLAGAIGVSNIMMVTVKERTSEIGIRRAIGATPFAIMLQIIAESVLLTAIAGIFGILLSVSLLQILELANTTDGIINAHFQISFSMALFSTTLLCCLGVMAGMAPAWRAMKIKPVEAMREE